MLKLSCSLVLSMGVLCSAAAWGQDPEPPQPKPIPWPSKLEFKVPSVDLGEVWQHHTYPISFPFEVVGEAAVRITELDSSTGVTKVEIRLQGAAEGVLHALNEDIPPGTAGTIHAVFDGSRYQREKQSTITVRGNFETAKWVLHVKAFVKPVFEVSPNVLQFGDVRAEDLKVMEVEKIVRVVANHEFEIHRWKRVPPGIKVKVHGTKRILPDGRVEQHFSVSVGKGIVQGRMSSSVIAETSRGIDLEFLVNVDVLGKVKYAPSSRVAFGIFDQGMERRREVRVEAHVGELKLPPPTVEIVGAAAEVMTAEVQTIHEDIYHRIVLRIGKEAPPGSYNGTLKITYPEESGVAPREIILNARIRQPR